MKYLSLKLYEQIAFIVKNRRNLNDLNLSVKYYGKNDSVEVIKDGHNDIIHIVSYAPDDEVLNDGWLRVNTSKFDTNKQDFAVKLNPCTNMVYTAHDLHNITDMEFEFNHQLIGDLDIDVIKSRVWFHVHKVHEKLYIKADDTQLPQLEFVCNALKRRMKAK